MFAEMTYEKLLADMLANVSSNVDKREGSVIWDALAPAALELSRLYKALDEVLKQGFADTAGREYLLLRALERGLEPYAATCAGALAKISGDVPIGARFYCEGFNWQVERHTDGQSYILRAEEAGSGPNNATGRLVPLVYIENLASAEIVDIVEPGAEAESTEAFRARYFANLTEQSFGGNRADYISKALGITGVGAVKVTAAFAGGGTVKLTIMNSEYNEAASELIELVQNTFDPPEASGEGLGLAPIGHKVTVVAAAEHAASVSFVPVWAKGCDWANMQAAVQACVDEYLAELREQWADADNTVVRLSQLEARILALDGVVDISGLKLDGAAANLILSAEEFPVRGDVSVE